MIPSTMLKSVVFKFPEKHYRFKREKWFNSIAEIWNSGIKGMDVHGPSIYVYATKFHGNGVYEVWYAPYDVESEASLCKFIPVAERVARNLRYLRNSILLFKWFVILLVAYALYKLTLAS